MKKLGVIIGAILFYLAVMLITQYLFLKELVLPFFPPGYISEHFWIRDYFHHFTQAALAIVIILLVLRQRLSGYGFNLQNWKLSRKYIIRFFLIYGLFTLLNFLPNFVQQQSEAPQFSLSLFNIVGQLSFAGLMNGTSEEILFRGLLQTFLAKAWRGSCRIWKWQIPTAGIIAAFIFAFAHVEFDFEPFVVSYSLPQIIVAFILGIIYSVTYQRTNSLIGPILMHNYANLIMYLIGGLTILLFS